MPVVVESVADRLAREAQREVEKQDSNRVQLEKEIADLLLREKDAVQHKRDELYRNLGKGLSLRLLETPLRT